jgi:hypothetical protein
MENCRYCGSEAGHAPSCPARPPESQRVREKEPVPGFEAREIHMVVGIVDTGSRSYEEMDDLLEKTTPENLPQLLAAEMTMAGAARREYNQALEGESPTKILEKMYKRSSGSHAFQCSLNKAEDFGMLRDRVAAVGEGVADDPAKRQAAETLGRFLGRQERMNDLMTELFKKDIALRIGDMKADSRFFEQAMGDFPALADEILESLSEYREANAALVATNQDVRDQLDNLTARVTALKSTPPSKAGRGFYGDVCMGYSMLVFEDSEHAEEEVTAAAEKLA